MTRIWRIVLTMLTVGWLSAPVSADEQAAPVRFTQVAPGVWKATVGTPEDLTLLTAAGVAPKVDALGAMPAAGFPL